jgi:hypothetical protein
MRAQQLFRMSMVGGLAVLSVAGCLEAPLDESDATSAALNGSTNGDPAMMGCNATQAQKIRDALLIARNQLQNPKMLECLLNAFTMGPNTRFTATETIPPGSIGRNTSYAELVLKRMNENLATKVSCSDLAFLVAAQAQSNISTEDLVMDRTFLNGNTTNAIAAIILHEVGHNKGFDHSGQEQPEYYTTWNWNLEECSRQVAANASPAKPGPFVSRADLNPETRLAPVGVENGDGEARDCTGTTFADTLWGYAGSAGVGRLGLSCKVRHRTDGSFYFTGQIGDNTSGSFFSDTCPPDTIMVGITGHASKYLGSVQPLCQFEESVLINTTSAPFLAGGERGSTADLSWRRVCPAGMAVKGVRARAVNAEGVKRLEINCQKYAQPRPIDIQPHFFTLGPGGGELLNEDCPGRSALIGLNAIASSTGITRLYGSCGRIATAPDGTNTRMDTGNVFYIPGAGDSASNNANRVEQFCNMDEALVGLSVGYDSSSVTTIRGLCSKLTDWRAGGSGLTRTTAVIGSSTPPSGFVDHRCPQNRFLVGWRARALSSSVRSIQALCRVLAP